MVSRTVPCRHECQAWWPDMLRRGPDDFFEEESDR